MIWKGRHFNHNIKSLGREGSTTSVQKYSHCQWDAAFSKDLQHNWRIWERHKKGTTKVGPQLAKLPRVSGSLGRRR